MDIFRILHPKTEYTFFSSSHGKLINIEQILSYKTHLNKFKIIEIIQSLLSDYQGADVNKGAKL